MAGEEKPIEIPPSGTKGSGMPFGGALMVIGKPFFKRQIASYRKNSGDSQPKMFGFPIVLLTTVGAKTGVERTHVLGGFPDGDDAWLVVASKGGAPTHPAWFVNLAKSPDKVWLEVGKRKFRAKVDSLRGEERVSALARVAKVAPRYGEYQVKTDREIPVLRVTPAA